MHVAIEYFESIHSHELFLQFESVIDVNSFGMLTWYGYLTNRINITGERVVNGTITTQQLKSLNNLAKRKTDNWGKVWRRVGDYRAKLDRYLGR